PSALRCASTLVLCRRGDLVAQAPRSFETKERERIMKKWCLSILFLAILIANSSSTIAQDKEPRVKDFSSLINQVFAPVTETLKLTQEQQFQTVAIITKAEVRVDLLLHSLEIADQQLSDFSFSGVPDGTRLKELCDQEAAILSEIMQLKV